jgi:hypothetical protein
MMVLFVPFFWAIGLLALLAPATSAAKIYLCGDSTMEKGKTPSEKEGPVVFDCFLGKY